MASLSNDALFRIEVSLSSRKSSAIVMRTHARLYSLDKSSSAGQWKSLAYGAPCIQLMRETTAHNSPFHIKLVIAEVESGISLWEGELTDSSGYSVMQTSFHTFSNDGKTFAVQFASESEAQRMLESLRDLFLQKQRAETVSFESKPHEPIFKKPKPFKRMSKKDISAPCNFKHVSGITGQRTQLCEDELRGTIQRKLRSNSISNISVQKVKQPAQEDPPGESPSVARSILSKFGSLRGSRKKASERTDSGLQSLPTHARPVTRPALQTDTFNHSSTPQPLHPNSSRPPSAQPYSQQQHSSPTHPPQVGLASSERVTRKSPNRSLSFSSNDVNVRARVNPKPRGAELKRRHTIVDKQFNYVPYRERHYSSDAELNKAHYQVPVPTSVYQVPKPVYQVPTNNRSATLPASNRAIPYAVVPISAPMAPKSPTVAQPTNHQFAMAPSNAGMVPQGQNYPHGIAPQNPYYQNFHHGMISSSNQQVVFSSTQHGMMHQQGIAPSSHVNYQQEMQPRMNSPNGPHNTNRYSSALNYQPEIVSSTPTYLYHHSSSPAINQHGIVPASQINPQVRPVPVIQAAPQARSTPPSHSRQRIVPPQPFRMNAKTERKSQEYSPSHTNSKVAPPSTSVPAQGFQPNDSLATYSTTSFDSSYTDQMDKALEQFDNLLPAPNTKKQIIQTSL